MLKMRFPGFTAQYSLYRVNERYRMAGAAAPVGGFLISSVAPMLGVTSDECLARGLCAYVSPRGRVTCGPCPGQARALDFAAAGVPDSFVVLE
jgi:hypothetical protein